MNRYLAIFLMTAILGLVLWLPAAYTARQFYGAVRLDHTTNEQFWGEPYAANALRSAIAFLDARKPPAISAPAGTGPTGQAERQLANRMQQFTERMRGAGYLRAMEAMTMLAFYRLVTMRYLAPAVALFLLPALVDAAVRRIVRTHEFRSHDPERYSLAIVGAMILCAELAILCGLPVRLNPLVPPAAMFGLVYCLHVALANYHHSNA